MPTSIVSLRGVSKSFPGRRADAPVAAVEDVTLDIHQGEVFGIIGYSGAGKSTLVRLINALEPATAGTITVAGTQITGLPERKLRRVRAGIGMIFQQFNLFASRTVAGNVAYPLRLAGVPRAERERRVAELLDFVGLADKAGAYPSQLSGGQKQRVGIARALATSPQLLLADESTSALDPETTADVLAVLRRVNAELGVTIVVITHEMDVVRALCHRVAVMERGRIVEVGDAYRVFADPSHPATARFVGSALHDTPTPDVLQRLRHRHPGRLVLVRMRSDGGSGGYLTKTLREFDVEGSIIYGGISEVAERPFGSLTIELDGDPARVEELVGYLTLAMGATDLGTAADPTPPPWTEGTR
ncbi:D-methionine transport system ATP-binding protein [Salana multivorans]|uniref:D-methionine transport system ATP-binding protein n=1 Tax=Salana multivorans TaxID=120377 RepID=A0A3N2D0Q7_9MICO|nr:methionine ABC transporter ATP-binding protein [Salana multivorans]OJX93766.1 MAG: methionine ABC transporter ATP-binding protein [Micrococcales bacterium 73-15]ROR93352.1 D-methionine transport system ATP-binding protein [Salana multivorans]